MSQISVFTRELLSLCGLLKKNNKKVGLVCRSRISKVAITSPTPVHVPTRDRIF